MILTRDFDVRIEKLVAVTFCPRRVFWKTARASFARKQQKITPDMAKTKLAVTDKIYSSHCVNFCSFFGILFGDTVSVRPLVTWCSCKRQYYRCQFTDFRKMCIHKHHVIGHLLMSLLLAFVSGLQTWLPSKHCALWNAQTPLPISFLQFPLRFFCFHSPSFYLTVPCSDLSCYLRTSLTASCHCVCSILPSPHTVHISHL